MEQRDESFFLIIVWSGPVCIAVSPETIDIAILLYDLYIDNSYWLRSPI